MTQLAAPSNATVLVVGRGVDDANQVREILVANFSVVEVSTTPGAEIADFERVKPQVLVLAYRELELAERCYLGLLRGSQLAHAHPHRAIILCEAKEVVAAFDLCTKGYFDDYVLYWPQSYDARRLAMSVWIGCRELAAGPAPGLGPAEVAVHAKRIKAMEDAIGGQLEAGARHAVAVREAMERTRGEYADAGATPQTLSALAASSKAVEPMSDWAQRLGGTIAPHLAGVRELVVKALARQPWRVVVALDAASAIAQLRQIRPMVILMDVNLPDIDGLALTEQLKTSPALAVIPILMLTSDSRREVLARSIKAGAAGFIVKPFTSAGLVAKLSPFLS